MSGYGISPFPQITLNPIPQNLLSKSKVFSSLTRLTCFSIIIIMIFLCVFLFQYTMNFVVYVARSDQYRTAFTRYLKTKLPCLFGVWKSEIHSTIFIINPGLYPSDTELVKRRRDKLKHVDVKLKYSLGNEWDCMGTIQVDLFCHK